MSYINFESARVKEELRNEKRKAREAVLEKAEADYKRRKEREKRAAERGEDKWMLPSLDAQLQPDSKKKKKDKKEKKKKKEKKHKHKSKNKDDKSDDSGSDSSSAEGQWVEKGSESQTAAPSSAPTQRDEWMTLPALFPCVNREQLRAQKRPEPTPEEEEALKKKFLLDNPGQSERELNPYWKDGGQGLPQVEEPQPESLALSANTAGDHGLAWLRRALRRVQEQAQEQGRSEESVAAERWGSLDKLKSMLADAERRCRMAPRDRGRGRVGRGGRVQGPKPRPKEYDDWREDLTAGESSATAAAQQSEEVGDKSRYRAWLGLKPQSPPREPSPVPSDSGSDNQRDDGPTVDDTGVSLKEWESGNKAKLKPDKDSEDSDDYEEEEDDDGGKIKFRSVKSRKSNMKGTSTASIVRDRINMLRKKLPLSSPTPPTPKDTEVLSDDDDKLFEEWRNERKNEDSSASEDEDKSVKKPLVTKERKDLLDETGKKNLTEKADENKAQKSSEPLQEKLKRWKKDTGHTDLNERRDERERRLDSEERDPTRQGNDCRKEYRKEYMGSKDNDWREKRRETDELGNGRRDRREDDKEYKYRHRQSYKEGDNTRERSREKNSPFSERKQNFDESRRKQYEWDDRNKSWRKDRGEDDKTTSDRSAEGSGRLHDERDRNRELKYRVDNSGGLDDRDNSNRRGNRDHQAGARRTEVPEYLRKRNMSPPPYEKAPPRRLGGFRKPTEDLEDSLKAGRPDILGDSFSSRGASRSKNWRKKEFQRAEEKVPLKMEVEVERSCPEPKAPAVIPPIKEKEKPAMREEEVKEVAVEMSDAEMNALGAKLLKAEILGNHALAAKLKAQLSQAQTARENRPQASAPSARVGAAKNEGEDTIILTQRDSKGFVRPLAAPTHPEPPGGRRKPQRIATHGADGLRERFFPDDDKYTLENLFQKEKMTTVEDANAEFSRLAAKGSKQEDLDDIFADKVSRERAPGKLQALERDRAIRDYKRVERSLDSCFQCFDSPRMLKHLMIALGSKVYLSLPAHQSLTEGHCLLSPIHHVPCATQLDEDVWEEMNSFRKALVAMFATKDEDCVFFESAMHLKRFPHMVLECVPLPREVGDTAPIYFKKAIMESEAEWSMNKKLVDLKGKGVRRAVPKGLPYFSVDFGSDDGFAHVIEDEKLFPENFAKEIIGGMLDLDHSLWRKPRRENFDSQRKKVIAFAETWKEFDITKRDKDENSSTSSESDVE